MSEYISAQTGPYMHSPALKFTKQFKNDDGGTRTFTVLFAGARNAGIIGPEDNGIVVLDEDHTTIVLDNYLRSNSGYFGPDLRVQAALADIRNMEWPAFAKFCRDNPRYRGSVPDINAAEPEWQYLDVSKDAVLVTPEVAAVFADSSYSEGIAEGTTRKQAEDYLLAHSFHRDGPYDDWRLSWNIKVGSFDSTGTGVTDYPVNRYLDAAWTSACDSDDGMFGDVCQDALSQYLDDGYTTFPGEDQGDYEFGVEGRSGGHLVLRSVKGLPDQLHWDGQGDFREFLGELTDAQVLKLLILAKSVDQDLSSSNRNQEMAYQYAFRRQSDEGFGNLYSEFRDTLDPDEVVGLELAVNGELARLEVQKATGLILTPPCDRIDALAKVAVLDVSASVFDDVADCLRFPDGVQRVTGFDFNKQPIELALAA